MANIYDINGNVIPVGGGGGSAINYDKTIKAINHKGYNTVAPENTIPAFKLSKQMGFNYVETDIIWTADGVPVLSHNDDISHTSNGTGNITEMTYQQLLQYDFSKLKPAYSGTKIATAEELLKLCRAIGLHPYLEIKHASTTTETNVNALVSLVESCGMKGKVTYIAFNQNDLAWVHAADLSARLCWLWSVGSPTEYVITTANALRNSGNDFFFGANYANQTAESINEFIQNGFPLELWTVNSEQVILDTNPYVTGFTSDSLIAGKVLYEAEMSD